MRNGKREMKRQAEMAIWGYFWEKKMGEVII